MNPIVTKKKYLNQPKPNSNNLIFYIYMQDVIHDIQVIEEDVKDVEQKCEKINCMAVYEAIIATIKLIYDILFCCCKKKD
jgi:hypothetical protein